MIKKLLNKFKGKKESKLTESCRNCQHHWKRKIPVGGLLTAGERVCTAESNKPLDNYTSKWYSCSKYIRNPRCPLTPRT